MDLIDRQELLDELRWVKSQAKASHQEIISDIIKRVEQQYHKPCNVSVEIREPKNFTRSEIRRLAIQQEVFPQKRGEWVEKKGKLYCSECGSAKPYFDHGEILSYWVGDYCRMCGAFLEKRGADMRGEEDDKRDRQERKSTC